MDKDSDSNPVALLIKDKRKNSFRDLDSYIPKSQFTSRDGDQPQCAICLESIIDGDEIRNLKCSHCFHSKCVDIWLIGTLSDEARCPTCRQALSEESPQNIIAPIPLHFHPPLLIKNIPEIQLSVPQDDISTTESSGVGSGIGSVGSNSETIESTNFQPQDNDIPREIFMRVGQFLLDEGATAVPNLDTPSPLMSPDIRQNTNILAINQSATPNQGTIPEVPRSRSSSLSSVSSNQSFGSISSSSSSASLVSISSYISISTPMTRMSGSGSGSGIYINYSALTDILSFASG